LRDIRVRNSLGVFVLLSDSFDVVKDLSKIAFAEFSFARPFDLLFEMVFETFAYILGSSLGFFLSI
jgi:hypothetical protein